VTFRDGLGREDVILAASGRVHFGEVLRWVNPRHVRKPLWRFKMV